MAKVLQALLLQLAFVTAAAASPGNGDIPPDLVGLNRDGKEVRLSAYQGKAIVLSFWATWCPYCLKELPILHNIQQRAGKDRIQVIAVNTEEYEVFWRVSKTLAKLDIGMAHDDDGEIRAAYGVNGIPHMVIIGRDGRIVAVHRGYNENLLPEIADNINQALRQE